MKLKLVIVPISGMQAKGNGGNMAKSEEEMKQRIRKNYKDLMNDEEFEIWWNHNINQWKGRE